MRLHNQVLSLFITLVISFVSVARSSAQEGTEYPNLLTKALKNVHKSGRPSEKFWRGNLADFTISQGKLSLNTRDGFGTRLLSTSVQLGKLNAWSGRICFDKFPTKENYAYILLSDLPQYQKRDKEQSFKYLALSIGGRGEHKIALVLLPLSLEGENIKTSRIVLGKEVPLITSSNILERGQSLDFDFKVAYDYAKAKLSLKLDFHNKLTHLSKSDTIDWQELLPQKRENSFGILLNYSQAFGQAMHFDKLCITNGIKEEDKQPPVDKSKEEERNNENTGEKEGNSVHKSIIITEVMPNPKANSAEYLELYNPNSKAEDLSSYQIGIGSNESKIKCIKLHSIGYIPAKSCLVLSRDIKAILKSYPSCPESQLRAIALPRMNNKGCYIYLYKNEAIVDGLYYNPKRLPRGYQSKKGLAWERGTLATKKNLEEIPWTIGTGSPTDEKGGLSNDLIDKDKAKDSPSTIKKLNGTKGNGQEISLEEAQARLEKEKDLVVNLKLYNLMGVLLYESQHTDARTFLKKPFSNDYLGKLPKFHSNQIIISLLTLSNPKEKKQAVSLTLKGFYPKL